MEKNCTTCLRLLPLTAFYRRKDGRSRGATCKECEMDRVKGWRKTQNGKRSALLAVQKYNASEHGKQKRAEYNATDSRRDASRRYDQSKKGKAAAARHRVTEKRKAALRRYYEMGKGKAAIARYQATDKGRESLLRGVHKRRSRIGTVSTLTAAEWAAIKTKYKNRCVYCLTTEKQLTRDHIIALAEGGQHVASNIVPACRSCNSRKGKRSLPIQMLATSGS